MPVLTSLSVLLKGDSSSLVKASRAGLRAVRNLGRGVGLSVAKVTGLAGAITGLTGTAGLLALGKASATNVDRLGKLSTQLGISGTEVQKLQLQAELSGLKLDDLAKSFQRVTRLTGDAIAGSKEAGKIFDRLGLSTKALAESSPAKNFEAVILRLGKMRDATKRASIGNKLFEVAGFESGW